MMRWRQFAPVLFFAVATAVSYAQVPHMLNVTPKDAKPGSELVVTGIYLNTNLVDEVYLTDHKFDMKVKVLEQKDDSIKFRIPPFAKPGRLQLMVLTREDTPKLLEQPVYIQVQDDKTTALSAKK